MTADYYSTNAEWYAALVAPWQDESNRAVSALLGRIDGGAVIDIASGVGTGLPLLRRLGAERLFAVEPSVAMRVGLLTTIAGNGDLMRSTTIVPAPLPDALDLLPDTWSAAVMLNAIGHLTDDARRLLWAAVSERLRPTGRFVLSLQPPDRVTTVPWTDFGTVQIGEHRLSTRGQAEPLDNTRVMWTMEWSLTDGEGTLLERRTAHHPWRVLNRTSLTKEAADWGLIPLKQAGTDSFFAFEKP